MPAGTGAARHAAGARLIEVDPGTDSRWDPYVSANEGGSVYHHSGWLRALRREYAQSVLGLALEDANGALRGLLALMPTRGLPLRQANPNTGRRLSSLPRTPLAGPLADDRAGLGALVRAALERTPPGVSLQLKTADAALEGLVPGVIGTVWRTTYVVELPSAPQELRFGSRRNNTRIRSSITTATDDGVRVMAAEEFAEVRDWYRLYLETMRHHVVPARPLRLFEALWEELRPLGMMQLLLARRQGELLAGSVLLRHGRTTWYAFNGSSRAALRHRPNDMLQWHALHAACAAGDRWYDLGEVAEHSTGLAHFKRKWGAEPHRLHRYSHPAPPAPIEDSPPSRAVAHAWRTVPLGLTALAGRLTYRYL
jgi:CelD/BcsL family acetyltransferase involved in cellulose biosynthesis